MEIIRCGELGALVLMLVLAMAVGCDAGSFETDGLL